MTGELELYDCPSVLPSDAASVEMTVAYRIDPVDNLPLLGVHVLLSLGDEQFGVGTIPVMTDGKSREQVRGGGGG